MLVVVHIARIGNHAKITVARGQNGFSDAPNIPLVLHAVAYEVRYRQHFHAVPPAKFLELRHARHCAIFIHDFADHSRGIQSSDSRKINAGFCLTGADKHASDART
jgi:hypothetical protein